MKLRYYMTALAVASVVVLFVVAPVAPAASSARSGSLTTAVTGSGTSGTVFNGILNLTGVAAQNGQLVANGTLTGTLTDALGNVITTITQAVTVPLQVSGSCTILHLDLQPISLDVLGLQVTTSEIVLDVSAQAAPGNLVGNLLCTVTHLLDNPGATLNGVANLLNTLLGAL